MIAAILLVVSALASASWLEGPARAGTEVRVEADASGGGERPAERCRAASKLVRRLSETKLERTLACAVNEQRSLRGLEPVALDVRLGVAAAAHARRMVRDRCFSHQCQGELDLEGRLRESGYLTAASDWSFAEDIGCAATVEAMVKAWLRDRSSRRNMLNAEFRDLGVGFTKRPPRGCDGPSRAGGFTLVLGVAER